jgi:RNA polymerase sigma-70 factor (ECF subfamily)
MRTWWLTIVRNTRYTRLHKNRRADSTELFDEEIRSLEPSGGFDPETHVLTSADKETLDHALEELPDVFREALVLREMEGMSYQEIADVTSVSLGMVMSRLKRARMRLRQSLSVELSRGY